MYVERALTAPSMVSNVSIYVRNTFGVALDIFELREWNVIAITLILLFLFFFFADNLILFFLVLFWIYRRTTACHPECIVLCTIWRGGYILNGTLLLSKRALNACYLCQPFHHPPPPPYSSFWLPASLNGWLLHNPKSHHTRSLFVHGTMLAGTQYFHAIVFDVIGLLQFMFPSVWKWFVFSMWG